MLDLHPVDKRFRGAAGHIECKHVFGGAELFDQIV